MVEMIEEAKPGVEAAVIAHEQFSQLARDDEAAVLAARNLVFQLCLQNCGDHGDSALEMTTRGVAL